MILSMNTITQSIELLKWNLFKLQMILMLNTMKNQIKEILNVKLVIMLEFLSIKIFLLKDMFLIGRKKFLLLLKLKIQFHGLMLLMILMMKKLLEVFMKKNRKRLIKKNLEKKKYLREKVINYMLDGKGTTIHLTVGLIKKTLYNNEQICS